MNKKLVILLAVLAGAFVLRFLSGVVMGLFHPHSIPSVSCTSILEDSYTKEINLSGRVVGVSSANVTSKVEGLLLAKHFEEGSFVKKGQKLFSIDPEQYAIASQKASADVKNAKAALVEQEKNLVRIKQLVDNDFVSKSEYDKALAQRDMGRANLAACQANLANANMYLRYTTITAPVSGRIGNLTVTLGNYITPATPCLVTVVSMDPIYVSFDISAKDYLELKKHISSNDAKITIKLPDGSIYKEAGKLDFYNNKVEESTGTVKLRATFNNPDNLLLDGEFVDACISFGSPKQVYTLPQNLVLQDSRGKFVYTVDKSNKIKIKQVEAEEAFGNKWIITKGLSLADKVVCSNLQELRDGISVKIKEENN